MSRPTGAPAGHPAVRRAGVAHAALLAALQADAFGDGPTVWPADVWTEWLAVPGVVALIARCDTVPLGFALGRAAGGEGEVLSLAVAVPARRRGLGRSLLARLAAELADFGAARLFLEVAADNAGALALYGDGGFRPVGRRKGYYQRPGGPVDALVLERR